MIRLNQIKLPIFDTAERGEMRVSAALEQKLLRKKAAKLLKIREDGIRKLRIVRRSVDAREKKNILFVYVLDVKLHDSISGPSRKTEEAFVKRLQNRNIAVETEIPFVLPEASGRTFAAGQGKMPAVRPIIVGTGPCGLFAAHTLCRLGLYPIVIERGERMEKRRAKTERFFETGKLDPDSNVQFGEGGAGTFSDGKLNTSVKGQGSYIRYVLECFYEYGADADILYEQKPHIGTDRLSEVVVNLRNDILRMGGDILFDTKLCGIETEAAQSGAAVLRPETLVSAGDAETAACAGNTNQTEAAEKIAAGSGQDARRLSAVRLRVPADREERRQFERVFGKKAAAHEEVSIPCEQLILALGHSARDTFSMLYESGLFMEQKAFAMGVRVQHPQRLIDEALYGSERLSEKEALLGPASYKLTHRCENGRSIYSFCMCPGGYVVNSSSEEGRLCVNGMSYHGRDSENANAALIVNVTTSDFPSEHPLAGIELQRRLEETAYKLCGGAIPCETYGDFKAGTEKDFAVSSYANCFQGYYAYADLRRALPDFMREALLEGMEAFGRSIRGFDSDDAILSMAEARTSSPVRIPRGEDFSANISGIYPAGEGAGYAGGITSAAVDGVRTALACWEQRKKDLGSGYGEMKS